MKSDNPLYGGDVYVNHCDSVSALSWVTSLIESIVPTYADDSSHETVRIYEGMYQGQKVGVSVTVGTPDADWTLISFGGQASPLLPWEDDVELARRAFQFFRHEVRCDPRGHVDEPYTDRVWSISSAGERLVYWEDV